MRALVPLVVALLAAGCLTSGEVAPKRVEVCLEQGAQADWVERGASAALLDGARKAGWTVETQLPRDGFPVPMGTAVVVAWEPRPPLPRPVVRLFDVGIDGSLLFELASTGDAAEDERLFRTFLDGVGLGEAPERDAWVATLLAAPTSLRPQEDVEWRRAEVRAEPDLSGLFGSLEGAQPSSQGLGGAVLSQNGWRVDLRLPFHVLRTEVDGRPLRLSFDAHDRLRAETTYGDREQPWPILQARVGHVFTQLGLPPPTFENASGGRTSCPRF